MTTFSTTIVATNGQGTLIRTFGDVVLARRWARENEHIHDGLVIEEVTTAVSRRRVYRPRRVVEPCTVIRLGVRNV